MSQQVTGLAGRQSQWCTVKTALILPRQPLPWFWERCSRISSLGNSPGSLPRPRGEFQGEAFVFAAHWPPQPHPPQHRAESSPGRRRGVRGAAGQPQEGCSSPGHFASCLCLAAAASAPARVPSQHPHSVQGLTDL